MRIANIAASGSFEPSDIPEHLISPGVSVENIVTEYFVYPGDAVNLLLDRVSYLEAAVRAEALGVDAILINSTLDYGLAEARAAVRTPIVGAGQASMLAAAALGRTFSIVSIWPSSLNYAYRELLRTYALDDRCVSIRNISSDAELVRMADDDSFYNRMRAGREDMLAQISVEIERAVEIDGADVIMLGCTCMSPVAAELGRRAGVPVVDAEMAGYLAAEVAGRTGLLSSSIAYQLSADPRPEMLAELAGVVARTVATEPAVILACEVCEIIHAV